MASAQDIAKALLYGKGLKRKALPSLDEGASSEETAISNSDEHSSLSSPPVALTAWGPQQPQPQSRYKGVRQRSWGRWVTEIREPATRQRVWLGSYSSAEEAARVYDMASLMLRGTPPSRLNFPNDQIRPVTVPRAIADSLLRAARSGHVARTAGGKSATAAAPSAGEEMKFSSEWVLVEVSGANVLLTECATPPPGASVTNGSSAARQTPAASRSKNHSQAETQVRAAKDELPAPSAGLRGRRGKHALGVQANLPTEHLMVKEEQTAGLSASSGSAAGPESPTQSTSNILPAPSAATVLPTPTAVAVKAKTEEDGLFDALNLNDRELFGEKPSSDEEMIDELTRAFDPFEWPTVTPLPALPAVNTRSNEELQAAAMAIFGAASELLGFVATGALETVQFPPAVEETQVPDLLTGDVAPDAENWGFWTSVSGPSKKIRV